MAFKDSRCPACDILEGKRLQADSIHSFPYANAIHEVILLYNDKLRLESD